MNFTEPETKTVASDFKKEGHTGHYFQSFCRDANTPATTDEYKKFLNKTGGAYEYANKIRHTYNWVNAILESL